MQASNNNPAQMWGVNTYKVGDPVLFNESKIFAPLIYNNLKGRIVRIEMLNNEITFDLELEISINALDANGYDFKLLDNSDAGNSIIRFSVQKQKSTDTDSDYVNDIVPFNIAYAVSIHKAQGLEYNSVKVVITDEIEERISHNIFYTAITRSREKLKIYWTPETQNKVLNKLERIDSRRDWRLLSNRYKL